MALAAGAIPASQAAPDLNSSVHEFSVASPRFLDRCHVGTTLDQMARKTQVPVGFEPTGDCWFSPRSRSAGGHSETLKEMTVRQSFDYIVALMPGYAWRDVGGVVVVRPRTAWNDANDLLNFSTKPFEVAGASPVEALHRMLLATTPSLFHEFPEQHDHVTEWPDGSAPVNVTFAGGTVLDALSAIVRGRGNLQWQLGYANGRATVAMYPLTFPSSGLMEQLARVPQP
jgi:hypothetical protein